MIATRPHTSWRPLHVYTSDAGIGATIRRTYGYRAQCDCGWLGPVRRVVVMCRIDIAQHSCDAAPTASAQ